MKKKPRNQASWTETVTVSQKNTRHVLIWCVLNEESQALVLVCCDLILAVGAAADGGVGGGGIWVWVFFF